VTTPARRAAARKTVAYLRQQAGRDAPRLPPFAELLELGEAYVAEVGDGSEGSMRETLGEAGQVFVGLDPARGFGAQERLDDETARRELTELLLDAKQVADGHSWRVRRRSTGLDISAQVRFTGRLLVVEHVSVRPHNTGGSRRG
jgi:hypothetical protein